MAEKIVNARVQNAYDTAENWNTNNPVLKAGELGIESDTGLHKVGDGTSTWKQLHYAGTDTAAVGALIEAAEDNMYALTPSGEEEDTAVLATVGSPKKGDIAVIKRVIAADKHSYTAYVYDGTKWEAADGNYNANNVYFDQDLIITANIGVQTVGSTGSKTLDTTGKNVKQVLDMIMAAEKNPTITQPSVSITCSQMGNYEVGTQVTPQFSVALNAGNYQYGPATGVTATGYTVTDTDDNTADQASGSFPQITVSDDENYSISATVTHTEGAVPKTNLGNDYAAGKIAAGSKSGTKGTITGHRKSFYGTTTDKGAATTSAIIRGLAGKSSGALKDGSTFTVPIPVGALRVLIAYPATLRDVTSIKDVNGMNAEIKSGFALSRVQVEGANKYSAIEYKVYTLDFATANDTANTYSVTI